MCPHEPHHLRGQVPRSDGPVPVGRRPPGTGTSRAAGRSRRRPGVEAAAGRRRRAAADGGVRPGPPLIGFPCE